MRTIDVDTEELAALDDARAFADLTSFRKIRVSGADAATWLHDLVTANVAGLEEGSSARSLLLSPTGGIRADFQVARDAGGFLLLQDDAHPDSIADLLSPFVLSSDVRLDDVGAERVLIAVLGDTRERVGLRGTRPSVAGPGTDLIALQSDADALASALTDAQLRPVSRRALAAWRVRLGIPTFGVDFDEGTLPSEAGLESAIDFEKGCFLGQESVAKVRNLGHPRRILVHLRADRLVAPGAPILDATSPVGEVTSVAPRRAGDGSDALGRIGWDARHAELRTPDGVAFARVSQGEPERRPP